MTTPNTEIGTTTLRTIPRAAEGCAVDGQAGQALMMDAGCRAAGHRGQPAAAGLAILSRMGREEQREMGD